MRDNDRIQLDWLDAQLDQGSTATFTGIDQDLVLPCFQKKA
jgi:hypothetical protein